MNKWIEDADLHIIRFTRWISKPFARFTIFLIFFWFGALKLISMSAATPLVEELVNATFLSGINPSLFVIGFGIFEIILGFLILFPRMERVVFPLLLFHLVTTAMPLFLLPETTWESFLVPTLTGQYIIKNVLLVSLMVIIIAQLQPLVKTHRFFS